MKAQHFALIGSLSACLTVAACTGSSGTPTSLPSVLPSGSSRPPSPGLVVGEDHVAFSPARPVSGTPTRVTITGTALGGQYLVGSHVRFGDGKSQSLVAGRAIIPTPPSLVREPFRVVITHVWRHPGRYRVQARLGALCEPGVPKHTVRFVFSVH